MVFPCGTVQSTCSAVRMPRFRPRDGVSMGGLKPHVPPGPASLGRRPVIRPRRFVQHIVFAMKVAWQEFNHSNKIEHYSDQIRQKMD